MENPWGDPWTTDGPGKIELPATDSSSRRPKLSTCPWPNEEEDENAWGGWSAAGVGRESPGWGASPGLRPVAGVLAGQASPDPWPWGVLGALETGPETVVDSAMRLGENGLLCVGSARDTDTDGKAGMGGARDAAPADVEDMSGKADVAEVASPDPSAAAEPEASRVQELVEMFDGIAKRSVSAMRKASPVPGEGFGPDAVSEVPKPGTLPALEADEQAEEAAGQEIWDGRKGVSFPIDLSNLDDIFPPVPATALWQSEPEPAHMHDNSFTRVSERKAWYRISRAGSVRQHDHGDDESYVRVSWAGSRVREQTVAVVRRWMEEDSIGGRVVRGRRLGAAGASMFNWDSDAPPVEIGELLRRSSDAAFGRGGLPASAEARPPDVGASPAPSAMARRGVDKEPQPAQDDDTVASILSRLPDLSYMLR